MGVCIIENEHVVIDSIYNAFPKRVQTVLAFFNYAVTLVVLYVMLKYGSIYAKKFGGQISMGMGVPMIYMYGIIPVGCATSMICVVVKMVELVVKLLDKEE